MKIRLLLATICLFAVMLGVSTAGAAVRVVTPSPLLQAVDAGVDISIQLNHPLPAPCALDSLGLAVRVHWDSTQLEYQRLRILHEDLLLGVSEPYPDDDELDGDPATDRYLVLAWVDVDSMWPGGECRTLTLAELDFRTTAALDSATSVRLTAPSSPVGDEFDAAVATVALLLDHDGDGLNDDVDPDDDNDGQLDGAELACGSDPLDGASRSPDLDGDNDPDCTDPDRDGDGVADAQDADPTDPDRWMAVSAGADQVTTVGSPILFSGSIADPKAAGPYAISWAFGDGARAAGDLSPTYAYANPGLYEVSLFVTAANGATASARTSVQVDGTPAVRITPVAGLVTDELGAEATFSVVLGSAPSAPVLIDLESDDPTEGDVAPTALVFDAADWWLTRTVTVSGIDDAEVDGPMSYRIAFQVTSDDPNYASLLGGSVQVVNADNDAYDALLNPAIFNARVGEAFALEVQVDSHGLAVGAYDIEINFDPTRLQVDTSVGDRGVEIGDEGMSSSLVGTDNSLGRVNITGFDANGVGPGEYLQFLLVHFLAGSSGGVTDVGLEINALATPQGDQIGILARGATVNVGTPLCGDANSDEQLSIIDALWVARSVVGLDPWPFDPVAADVTRDQLVEIVDALMIARRLATLATPGTCLDEVALGTLDAPGMAAAVAPDEVQLSGAAATAGTASLRPVSATVDADGRVVLDVQVDSGVNRLGSYTLVLHFDPTHLQLETSADGQPLIGLGADSLGTNLFNADNDTGTLTVTGFDQVGRDPGADLFLLSIPLRALASDGSTEVTLEVRSLTDELGQPIGIPTGQGASIRLGDSSLIDLAAGLNLLPYPWQVGEDGLNCADLLAVLGGPTAINALARLNPDTGAIEHCAGAGGFPIRTGEAYLVHASVAVEVEISAPLGCVDLTLQPGPNYRAHPNPAPDLTCYQWLQSLGRNRVTAIQQLDTNSARMQTCGFWNGNAVPVAVGMDYPVTQEQGYILHSPAGGTMATEGCR